MKLSSHVFEDGHAIPVKFTQEGENVSPPLRWEGVSPRARELVLFCEDPDAPGRDRPFVHWVLYGLDPSVTELPEGLPKDGELKAPVKARQGRNSNGQIGFDGPRPPDKDPKHRYYFKLFALERRLDLPVGLTADVLYDSIRDVLLGEAELMGTYQLSTARPEIQAAERDEKRPGPELSGI